MSAVGSPLGTAVERVRAALDRVAEVDRPEVWVALRPEAELLAEAAAVDARVAAGEDLPLAGLVAAVKNNTDVAGLPTTAACPSFATAPAATDAVAVARLRAAGAVVLGATNLDQFATGLVGTRSPYGAVRHATHPDRISGGSSSGSAVAVALGVADVALGTDTAGSGRVPAAFHGLVGLKPTRGLVPTTGVVPACRSLDCVSVFARTVDLAERVLGVLAGPDDGDPLSQPRPLPAPRAAATWTVGVPAPEQLGPLAPGWAEAFAAARDALATSGVALVEVDVAPALEAAAMLYGGAFVAERYAAVGAFLDTAPADADPTVAAIITGARDVPAWRVYRDAEVLDGLRERSARAWTGVDAVRLPTTVRHPALAGVAADPLGVNAELGRCANFANLFDLAALAVPAGAVDGLPFGVQLVGPAGSDAALAVLGRVLVGDLAAAPARWPGAPETVPLVVVGAHLAGQPLNGQLSERGGVLDRATRTAPGYRLHALATTPPKPGLERVAEGGSDPGASIEVEVWRLPAAAFADFVAALPQPMAIGSVDLADGTRAPGFLCEPAALVGAREITASGGWRAYLAEG